VSDEQPCAVNDNYCNGPARLCYAHGSVMEKILRRKLAEANLEIKRLKEGRDVAQAEEAKFLEGRRKFEEETIEKCGKLHNNLDRCYRCGI